MLYFTLTGELAIVFRTCDLTSGLRSICRKAHNFGNVVVAVKDIKLLNNELVFQTQLATSLSLFRVRVIQLVSPCKSCLFFSSNLFSLSQDHETRFCSSSEMF